MEFGAHLKEWRVHRRISQLDLAGDAGISARHLSFLETGRARPSEGMIIRLAEALSLPAGAQNTLFAAAGFAPRFRQSGSRGMEGLAPLVADTLRLILDRHAPWPAVAFDADHEIIAANAGFSGFATALGVDLQAGGNILSMVVEEGPVRAAILNWREVAGLLLKRARNEAWLYGPKSPLARRLRNYAGNAEITALLDGSEGERNPPPVITVRLLIGGVETEWITTLTAFGAAQDVISEGIFIEQYFPADPATRAFAEAGG
jgi:transcriptional regulator with XRE-family HTH domain